MLEVALDEFALIVLFKDLGSRLTKDPVLFLISKVA
jgi:hypothetical protein